MSLTKTTAMTLNEFKEAIAKSEYKEWYQAYELEINYPYIKYKNKLKGVVNIYNFVLQQSDGYSSIPAIPAEFDNMRSLFISVKGNILKLITQNNINKQIWDDNLRNISQIRPDRYIFLYESPETEFLLEIHRSRPEIYLGAYDFLTGNTSRPTQKNYFEGYMLAYEFLSKDFSAIAERKDKEKKSIASIRTEFQKNLDEAHTHSTEYISQTKKTFDEYANHVDTMTAEKGKSFERWFNDTKKLFENFNSSSAQKIKSFEELYQEKLKLEAPAMYWNKRAGKLRKEGYWWLAGLITCIALAVGILIWVLNKIADGTLAEIFRQTSVAVKWSVVIITIISFLAYAIRVFSKLTFSSFHLMRDAQEREQLTYVYLALQKEKGIDPTERHLIMQSLFSRADSGLLKDDASPTMPGNIIDQALKK